MSVTEGNRDNLEAHQELDARLREMEIGHSSLASTIVSMNANVNEMKNMFQKFMLDSAEISTRIETISRLEKITSELTSKNEDLSNRLLILEYSCKTCNINKVNDYIKDMSDKVNKIESTLSELKGSKTKMQSIWSGVIQTIITVALLYLFYMAAIHLQPTDNPLINAPTMKDKKADISFVSEANAGDTFAGFTTLKRSK